MRRLNGAIWLLMCGLVLSIVGSLDAKEAKRSVTGPLITIHAPHAQQFEVTMDEVELDWSRTPGAEALAVGRQASPAGGVRIVEREGVRARAAFAAVRTLSELQATVATLRAANPGADVYLILYEPGQPKSKISRKLLTREVGLLLEPGAELQTAIAGLSVSDIRPVAGVSGGYVVDAADPIGALDLADVLRQRLGVRHAYPLLRRQYVPR